MEKAKLAETFGDGRYAVAPPIAAASVIENIRVRFDRHMMHGLGAAL